VRKQFHDIAEKGRFTPMPGYESNYGDQFGMFLLKAPSGSYLQVMATAGMPGKYDWEHVSVSPRDVTRVPTWDEMCWIKSLFWTDDECVIQYHPAKKDYINTNEKVLHLWRPTSVAIPMPPKECV
jgi:hypothetical protein